MYVFINCKRKCRVCQLKHQDEQEARSACEGVYRGHRLSYMHLLGPALVPAVELALAANRQS
jgi:hypothetical protein